MSTCQYVNTIVRLAMFSTFFFDSIFGLQLTRPDTAQSVPVIAQDQHKLNQQQHKSPSNQNPFQYGEFFQRLKNLGSHRKPDSSSFVASQKVPNSASQPMVFYPSSMTNNQVINAHHTVQSKPVRFPTINEILATNTNSRPPAAHSSPYQPAIIATSYKSPQSRPIYAARPGTPLSTNSVSLANLNSYHDSYGQPLAGVLDSNPADSYGRPLSGVISQETFSQDAQVASYVPPPSSYNAPSLQNDPGK